MPRPCKNCKDSILNKQTSLISTPSCENDCPEDIACEGIVTYTDCVNVNIALDCVDTIVGDSLSTVLEAFDDKLCEAQDSNCTAKISSDDTCCGYLEDKITSTSLTVSTTSPGGCEKINIEEKCFVWNNINPSNLSTTGSFRNGWGNLGLGVFQLAQYTTVKQCTVKLRGTVTVSSYTSLKEVVAQLPVAPLTVRRFSVNVLKNNLGIVPTYLDIYPDGNLKLWTAIGMSETISFSLDSIYFETN